MLAETLNSTLLTDDLSNRQVIFYRELYFALEENYQKASFQVPDLAKAMNLHRRQLYREMANLGLSPAEFIRDFRLRRAYQLLQGGAVRRVKELCFMVGFENCETFSKHFIERFNERPSTLIRKQVA